MICSQLSNRPIGRRPQVFDLALMASVSIRQCRLYETLHLLGGDRHDLHLREVILQTTSQSRWIALQPLADVAEVPLESAHS